jgi:fucose permease
MVNYSIFDIVNTTNIFFVALTIGRLILFQDKYEAFKDDKLLVFLSIANVITSLLTILLMQFY